MELITGENDDDRRLDRILRKALPDYPLPLIHRLLRQRKILINGKPGKASDRIKSGVKIFIPISHSAHPTPLSPLPSPSFSKLKILWENNDLIAINKPSGISVHGGKSLDTIVRAFLADKLPPSLSFTPGPLHRLDKPTSGIVIFSKSIEGARIFSTLMREKKIKKTYLAVVKGYIKTEEIWRDELVRDKEKKKTFVLSKKLIKSKNVNNEIPKIAVTKITPLSSDGSLTLIAAQIETGRTHQIRAQAASHGFPLLGDVKYGAGNAEQRAESNKKADIFLHAWRLEFLDVFIEAVLPQTWIPIASRIASTNVLRSGSLPEIPGISTNSG